MIASPGRRGLVLVWMGALALGFVLRALPLAAARPYIAYVDEGNFLHPAFRLVKNGGWDPRSYVYPQFPLIAVAAAARAADPLYRSVRGQSLRDRIPGQENEVYDELEPFALLFIARCLSLALGLGTIGLTGHLAMRLAGPWAGAAAALLAAVTPALVLRASIATVDGYATFFVLACLCFTDLTRTRSRAGVASFLAGAMAGAAFACKYPSVLILVAFGVTTLLQQTAWGERLRRLCLAVLGLVAGALLAMPVLLQHPGEVRDAIRLLSEVYAHLVSPPLWKQALLRAEWDLPYDRAELGFAFLALSVGGLILGLRDRKIAATVWGWCAFAATSLILYGTQSFRPFRNLMPLVPPGCVAVALFFARIRERARRPLAVDAVALAWVFLAFTVPLTAYAVKRYRLEDTRTRAIDWLAARARPDDRIVIVRELGVHQQEVERLPAASTVQWWDSTGSEIRAGRPRFVVAGVFLRENGSAIDVTTDPVVDADYELRLRLGKTPTAPDMSWWHGNEQIVYVFERKSQDSRTSCGSSKAAPPRAIAPSASIGTSGAKTRAADQSIQSAGSGT